jgi:hypothetical protein
MCLAGMYEAIADTNSENIKIINIELKLISLGNFSKKYISLGNISNLKTVERNALTFSILNENINPKIIPDIVAKKPIVKPVKKKDFFIEVLFKPKVFNIAISLVLFLINIVRPEIILNAATIIIKVNIINITFLSTFKALKRDLFKSVQV